MLRPVEHFRRREQAAALVIVLALAVLLAGLAVAYLARTTTDRAVARGSFNQSKADQLAESAADTVIGDVRQEIVNGSNATTVGSSTIYTPKTAANMLPQRSGTSDSMPNLNRRSVFPDSMLSPGLASRASAVNSGPVDPANPKRGEITSPRWNKHYLIPRPVGANPTDTTPISGAGGFTAPDWVVLTRGGPVSFSTWNSTLADQTPTNDSYAVGRYAYAVYDEGGLLDVNVAGYPPTATTAAQYGPKGVAAFADLTALGMSNAGIDGLVGWRNYASAQPNGNFPNFTFNAGSATNFVNFVSANTNGFMAVGTSTTGGGSNIRTDQAFVNRQSLLQFRASSGFTSTTNALQYLDTFSREVGTAQWNPATPDSINPNFQTLVVTSQFTRNDGTTANVGDYLVNKRFLLQRLNWLTYRGPSGPSAANPSGRTIPSSAPAIGNANYDMWLLTRSNGITFGLTSAFLQQGTDANILKYFGLAWDTTNERWNYVGHGGSTSPIGSLATFGVGGATREPDFFELLQAGILNGSIADSSASYSELPIAHQQSPVLHILTIGANLIAQSRVDSYPVRIACTVGGTTMEAVGAPRLPYVNSLAACPVGVTAASGGMNWLLVPNLWDPFRDTWDLTEANTSNSGNGPLLTPGYLRPAVRITIRGTGAGGSGTVGFGAASTVSSSGRVAPVSAFSTLPFSSSSQTLATGSLTSGGGRDGFLQAMRMGASDISGLTSFNPTTLVLSPPYSWNSVARPANDTSTSPRTDNFAVFRLSANIPVGTGGYPVLILNPGFQVTIDYQSPITSTNWYSYSFLQGNNATSTWISSNLNIATNYSQYGVPAGNTAPTIVKSGTLPATPTRWDNATAGVAALAQAPMFAKADPKSIRYNSQIGTLTLAANSAGVIGSIWPGAYTSAPTMPPGINPATYSQTTGDNAPAA